MLITITECSANGNEWVHNSRTINQTDAIDRAVKKKFGKNAMFFADSELANLGMYGQILKSMSTKGSYKVITGRVRINID